MFDQIFVSCHDQIRITHSLSIRLPFRVMEKVNGRAQETEYSLEIQLGGTSGQADKISKP